MGRFVLDFRLGLRALIRSPGFTLVSIFTLALGIGASTSIFSVVNSVLLRQLPFPNAHELVGIWNTAPGFGFDILKQSETTYTIFQEFNDSFVDIGLVDERTLNLAGNGEPVRLGDFVTIIEELVGKAAKVKFVPAPVSEPPLTYANTEKAGRLLGYESTTSIREGLAKTWAWYQQAHDLS